MSINWSKSAELNSCTVGWLKARFERFPGSHKCIIAICDNCKRERKLKFQGYSDLCLRCSSKNRWGKPKEREKQSVAQNKRYEDPKERKKISIAVNKRYEDPKEREKQSISVKLSRCDDATINERIGLSSKKRYEDPEERERQSALAIERWSDIKIWEKYCTAARKRYEDPKEREKQSVIMTERWNNPIEREKQSARLQGITYNDWDGFTDKRRPHLTPVAKCTHLNPTFKGCNQHHIMSRVVINMPVDLHVSIWHRFPNGNEGKNMKEINELAFKYLMDGI